MDEVSTEVAVLKVEMQGLTRELRANTQATAHVSEQLEHAQLEPLQRNRNVRAQLFIAIAAAVSGGGFALLAAALASH